MTATAPAHLSPAPTSDAKPMSDPVWATPQQPNPTTKRKPAGMTLTIIPLDPALAATPLPPAPSSAPKSRTEAVRVGKTVRPQPTLRPKSIPVAVGVDDLAARRRATPIGPALPEPPTSDDAFPEVPRGWLELRVWAEMFHDAQEARKTAANRARSGVDPAVYAAHIEQLDAVEAACGKAMRLSYRRAVPTEVRAWQKEEHGIGEHLLARLLGHLGDPLHATPHLWTTTSPPGHVCDPARCGDTRHLVTDAPYRRTVGQLWAYCGHGDPTRRPTKGMTAAEAAAMGSPTCKMLVHLLAEAGMKQPDGNRYRDTYTARRAVTADRTHATVCVRCGPSGKPAAAGSAWSKAHQHADALRIVGKAILRDLWRARADTICDPQHRSDIHTRIGVAPSPTPHPQALSDPQAPIGVGGGR